MSQLNHRFIAARRAAQHCPELTVRGPGPDELRARWARLGAELAALLAPRLAPLLGGRAPRIAAAPAEAVPEGLSARALLAAPGSAGLLHLTIDGAALLQLVDRAFGGHGQAPQPLPEALPTSALLLAARIETALAAALAETLALPVPLAVQHSAERLPPPPASAEPAVLLSLTVSEAGTPGWPLTLCLPVSALAEWLGGAARQPRAPALAADPTAAPFADLPLPLRATLVDMRVPLSTAATLTPGLVLPVAVARAVPLSAGGSVIARGTIGQQDDRIALKLTQLA